MDIEAHIIAWNEEDVIRFTVDYYKAFCKRVVLYDNHSTDRTREIASDYGADVRLFGIKGVLSDKEYLKVKNHCWKGSDAHYVIVCDTDEILYHPAGIPEAMYSDEFIKPTVFRTQGFGIWDNRLPMETYMELDLGVFDESYSKKIVFSPKLREINYIYGCHVCSPEGNVVYGDAKFAVLHYHNIGGVERVIKRHALYEGRRSDHNRRFGMGRQYAETPEFKRKEWDEYYAKRAPLSQAGIW